MDVGFKRCQQKLAKAFSFESIDTLSKLFEHGKLVERELLISHELACRLCKDRDYLVALASFIAMIQGIMYLVHNPLSRDPDGLEPDLHEVGRVARALLVKQELAVPESVLVVDVFARLSHPKAMLLVNGILHEISRLVMNLDQGVSSKIGGRIIQDLMPFSLRKVLAAFYTKMPAAWMLSFIAIDSPATTVLDPACGTGNLLHAACHRKLELTLENSKEGSPVAPGIVARDLKGIELVPLAATLARFNLFILSMGDTKDCWSVETGNATRYYSSKEIDSSSMKASLTLSSKVLPMVSHVLMNPPFTKNESLDHKKVLRDRLCNGFEGTVPVHGRMGLFAYFIILADRFLNEEGRMACILPASFLRVKSCENLRKFLCDRYAIEYIISRMDEPNFSMDTEYREIMFMARKHDQGRKQEQWCQYILLNRLPSTRDQVERLCASIQEGSMDDYALACQYSQARMMESTDNWFLPLAVTDSFLLEVHDLIRKSPQVIPYHDVVSRDSIIRGMDSSSKGELSAHFILDPSKSGGKDAWMYLGKNSDGSIVVSPAHDIEKKFIVKSGDYLKAIRSTAGISTFAIKDIHDHVLVGVGDDVRCMMELVPSVHESSINQNALNAWRRKCIDRSACLFHVRRFDATAPGTVHLGYCSVEQRVPTGLTWVIRGIPPDDAKILNLWHNSSYHLLQVFLHRKETRGGYMAVDSYNFMDYGMIDVKGLDRKQRERCAALHDELANLEFPSLMDQLSTSFHGRMRIDALFKTILFNDPSDNLYSIHELHQKLHGELLSLKKMMAGGNR